MNTTTTVWVTFPCVCVIGSTLLGDPYEFLCLAQIDEEPAQLVARVRESTRVERILLIDLQQLPNYTHAWEQFLARNMNPTILQKECQP